VSLSSADGGDYQDGRAVPGGGAQAIEKPDILAIEKDVHVTSDDPLLIHDAVERGRRFPAQGDESFTHSVVRAVKLELRLVVCVGAKRLRQLESDQAAPTIPVLTQTIGGSASAISVHVVPSSREP